MPAGIDKAREWTIVPIEISKKLKADAAKSGRGSVSKEIAFIIKSYYEQKEIKEKK